MKDELKNYSIFFREGKIGVIPTDTIYGISASIFLPDTIEKVYKITNRNSKKPFIILIGSLEDLKVLEIEISKEKKKELQKLWPGKVSVILPCISQKMTYLHRGKKTLAIRLPENKFLVDFLKKTGPLISTSANPEGKVLARNIDEARKYFGDKIDFYVDEGELDGEPSALLDFTGEEIIKIKRK